MRSAFGKKLLGSRLAQSCCALVAMVAQAAPAAAGDLVFFDDQAEFEQANVDLGHAQKGVEDFEESTLPPRGGLIWFTDQAAFEEFNALEGNALEGIEDFEESILGPQHRRYLRRSVGIGCAELAGWVPLPGWANGSAQPDRSIQSWWWQSG